MQDDEHYLALLRYIEANPLRAKLVYRAEQWRWSSLSSDHSPEGHPLLSTGPLDRPAHWKRLVNDAMPEATLERIWASVNRGRPWGDEAWTSRIAKRLGLMFTLRDRGRPRKIV